ncbi:acetyltransferase [Vibrio vulnificus]|nr:acetyltransferase [Vibrio vulnificus]HAS8182962.1 acetyltransferase [Vibrio vulnificus]
MAQCFRFGWRRCSPLNWALCKYSNQPISQCLCLRLWM